ncbi:MAG: hypothetical protein R2849_09600 [Thermomicrobiales bacterium]
MRDRVHRRHHQPRRARRRQLHHPLLPGPGWDEAEAHVTTHYFDASGNTIKSTPSPSIPVPRPANDDVATG